MFYYSLIFTYDKIQQRTCFTLFHIGNSCIIYFSHLFSTWFLDEFLCDVGVVFVVRVFYYLLVLVVDEAEETYRATLAQMGVPDKDVDDVLTVYISDTIYNSQVTALESFLCRSLRKPEGERPKKYAKYFAAYGLVKERDVLPQLWKAALAYTAKTAKPAAPNVVAPIAQK